MTSTETGTSWSDRLSPRNWSLAWKLVAVGLIPALLAIVLGVLRVADQAQAASELGAANRLLEVRGQVADTATALRVERDRATAFVAEKRLGDRGPLQDAVRSTDAAIEQIRTGMPAGELDAATRNAVEQAQGGFAQLSVLRTDVDGSDPLPAFDVTQRYSGVIARTDVLDRALLREVRTPEVAGLVDALTAVTAASESVTLQQTVLGAALRAGTVSDTDRATVNATDNALAAAYTEYQIALPPTQTPINFITSRANAERDADKLTILNAPAPGPISVTVAQWDDVSQRARERIDAAGTDVRNALTTAGDTAEARSSNLAGVNSVLLMLGLLLAATIVVLVARTLTRSLRVLRTSALDVAQRRLPQAVESMRAGAAPDVTVEPVPLPNRDEVGQVARAFDAVHGQALRLAADQAALQSNVSSMFVNLSRRSQGLVERQLQLIEQLESNEQDPDQLSNLFQLDHLATRMRRNSENLLVLAGTDFAKRNVAPVPLVEVLRAAVSEIEHYQRITVQAPPQATVVGRATSDVVHLLAELLDNATNFSPPDAQVVMSSTRTADGSILVEIADLGVGMVENELADANRRLTTPSAVDVSASRRMGLFVVGRLGARHGITVHLGGAPMGGPGGGLTASVTLPTHLVVSSGDSTGGRSLRGDAALTPAAPPNGVPPQRAGAGPAARPAPRTTLAGTANGQAPAQPAALNGLPTRTPGSSLRRNRAPLAAETAESASAGRPFGAFRTDDEPGAPTPARTAALRPAVRDGDADELDARRAPDAPDATETSDADAVPTGAVPAVGAAGAVRTDEPGTDDTADTPPAGQVRGLPTATPSARPSRMWGAPLPTRRATEPSGPHPLGSGPSDPVDGASQSAEPSAVRDSAARESAARESAARDSVARDSDVGADGGVGGGVGGSTASDAAATAAAAAAAGPTSRPVADAEAETEGAATAGRAQADAATAAGSTAPAPDEQVDDGRVDATRADDALADGHTDDDAAPDGAADDAAAAERPASPRPRPTPGRGPNGTFHDLSVPSTPTWSADDGAGANGAANGADRHGDDPLHEPPLHEPPLNEPPLNDNPLSDGPLEDRPLEDGPVSDDPRGDPLNGDRYDGGRYGERNGGTSPHTTPLPVVPGAGAPEEPDPFGVPVSTAAGDVAADALFSASVPAMSEPDGPLRSRRPLADARQGSVDIAETTPIFEEIASAWFASQRPVPVDWELGRRPGAEAEPEPVAPAPTALDAPRLTAEPEWPAAAPPAPVTSGAPGAGPPAQAFASAADEGWRAASGAAAERPDELTAAGLPKRRPRARLVPGSAGSAVLAAPASPTRSAESIRGRLASYQQGVRQGRESRLRRDPGGAGSQPDVPEDNVAAPAGADHDEENR